MSAEQLVTKLAELLKKRRTSELFGHISNRNNNRLIRALPVENGKFVELLIIVAEAVELGYPNDGILQHMLQKLARAQQRSFAGCLAQGILATRKGKLSARLFFQQALFHKRFVSVEHVAFVRYCLSNNWRKRGCYAEGLLEIRRAHRLAEKANLLEIAADFMVTEAWFHLQRNKPDAAALLYDRAEPVLVSTGDHRRLGDIWSARGRSLLREGRLGKAADRYKTSLSYYRECPIRHRGFDRTLLNLARVEILEARQLRLQMHEVRRRLKGTTLATYDLLAVSMERFTHFLQNHRGETFSCEQLQVEVPKLCDLDRRLHNRNNQQHDVLVQKRAGLLQQAAQHLAEVRQLNNNRTEGGAFRGLSREMVIRGYLHIEERNWPAALKLAKDTFALGEKYRSTIVQTRAKIVETMAYVQQRWHPAEAASDTVALALESGAQAANLSKGLQEKRIIVKALTWSGLAQLSECPPNIAGARATVGAIEEQMVFSMPDDYVTEDADMLKRITERVAGLKDEFLSRLAEVLKNEVSWEEARETVLDLLIERRLRQNRYLVARVVGELKIHPRRVRPVRDRLLKAHPRPEQTIIQD